VKKVKNRMDTFSGEQAQTQNIISLFGEPILRHEVSDIMEEIIEEKVEEVLVTREDIFSAKIASADVSLEAGFVILSDQIQELRNRIRRTSFYLTDLENLLT